MPKYKYHPACLIFPPISDDELKQLALDIKQRGLQNPIVMHEKQVLDGRNRLSACKIAKVKPRFIEWDGGGSSVLEWVIAENLLRRHLSSGQRAVLALELLPLLEEEARQRQITGKKINGSKKGRSTQHAAEVLNTNFAYVSQIKTIQNTAPELVDEIRSGKLRVPEATEIAKLSPAKRKKELARTGNKSYVFQAGNKKNKRPTVIHTPDCVCRFLYDIISDRYNVKTILDPCSGQGNLSKPWRSRKRKVVEFEITQGRDFFECDKKVACDLVLCNPPFSGNGETVETPVKMFLQKILEVTSRRTPIVLIAPWGFRTDQTTRSGRWRWLRDECPQLTSIISLPCDIWSNARAHSEILLFNMRRLKPHYFLPEEYLE